MWLKTGSGTCGVGGYEPVYPWWLHCVCVCFDERTWLGPCQRNETVRQILAIRGFAKVLRNCNKMWQRPHHSRRAKFVQAPT